MKILIIALCALAISACNDGNTYKDHSDTKEEKIVFITHSAYSVSDIGGASNVDGICQNEASLSLFTQGKTFIAFYSVGGQDFTGRVTENHNAKWVNIGAYTIYGRDGFFYIGISDRVHKDQYGSSIDRPFKLWVNTDGYGDYQGGNDCNQISELSGFTSYAEQDSKLSLNAGIESCSSAQLRLICVEN